MAGEWLVFEITDRCHLDCQHCLRDPGAKPLDLEVSLISRVIDEVRALFPLKHVSFTGGEPMLHPQIWDILDMVVERDCEWHLVTSGKDFDRLLGWIKERPSRREHLRVINFSVDGASEETHDHIRGLGQFRLLMQTISLAFANGVPFSMNMTINALNQFEIEDFVPMAIRLGAQRAIFNLTQPTGTLHDERLYISPADWQGIQNRIRDLKSMFRLPIGITTGFREESPFFVCEPFRSEPLHVNIRGELNLCCQHGGVPSSPNAPLSDAGGNLRDLSFVSAHKNLLDVIAKLQQAKLDAISHGEIDEWGYFPCNWCFKYFDKPHWVDGGVGGVKAKRDRWKGAWKPEKQVERHRRLKIVG